MNISLRLEDRYQFWKVKNIKQPGKIARLLVRYTCSNFRSIYLKQWNVNKWDNLPVGFWSGVSAELTAGIC